MFGGPTWYRQTRKRALEHRNNWKAAAGGDGQRRKDVMGALHDGRAATNAGAHTVAPKRIFLRLRSALVYSPPSSLPTYLVALGQIKLAATTEGGESTKQSTFTILFPLAGSQKSRYGRREGRRDLHHEDGVDASFDEGPVAG